MSSSKFTRVVDLRPSLQPVNVQFIVLEKGARAGRRGVCHWRRRSVWRVCTDVSRALRPQGAVAVAAAGLDGVVGLVLGELLQIERDVRLSNWVH